MMEIKSDTRSTPISDGDFGVLFNKEVTFTPNKINKTVNKFMK